jgi:hypothetical protein
MQTQMGRVLVGSATVAANPTRGHRCPPLPQQTLGRRLIRHVSFTSRAEHVYVRSSRHPREVRHWSKNGCDRDPSVDISGLFCAWKALDLRVHYWSG